MRDRQTTAGSADRSGGWFSRARAKYGLGVLLVVVGAVLFFFPEPITSTVGVVLILIGVVVWLLG